MGMNGNIENLIDRYVPPDKLINVFIIGSHGYTPSYGGWETFTHGLIRNWTDDKIQLWVYEKVDSPEKEEIRTVNGSICLRVYEEASGSSSMPKYDVHCTNLTCRMAEKHRITNPVMYHLGVRIGPVLWMKKKRYRRMGFRMIENAAGAEWRRTKWGKILQAYLFVSAMMMAKSTDCLICDNEGMMDLYEHLLHRRKPRMEYIAYGADSQPRLSDPMPEPARKYFDEWGLEKDGYYLILGRYVPENNYEMMFRGFMKSGTKRKLLVITNYKTEIPKFHEHIRKVTGYEKDPRVIMAGSLYEPEILHYVRQYAHGYIHGHSVGGTNPGLLEAMTETDVNLLYNVDFNRYVGQDAAEYFSNEEELARLIDKTDSITAEEKGRRGETARRIIKEKYSWRHIVNEYDRVIQMIVQERE